MNKLVEALKLLRNHTSVNTHQIEIIDAALAEHRAEPSADVVGRVARAIQDVPVADSEWVENYMVIPSYYLPDDKAKQMAKAAIAAMPQNQTQFYIEME